MRELNLEEINAVSGGDAMDFAISYTTTVIGGAIGLTVGGPVGGVVGGAIGFVAGTVISVGYSLTSGIGGMYRSTGNDFMLGS